MAPDKFFSLEGKGLKLDTAEDLEKHIGPLLAMDDVEEVLILGNTLGVGACKRLGEVLATKKSLKVANLADIFTGRLLDEIPVALSSLLNSILNLPNLRTINLNDNAFGFNTQAPLIDFLSKHVPLQHLYLNNNGLGPHAGTSVADALSTLHAKKEEARQQQGAAAEVPDLETVICGRNRLEDGSMAAWAKAFSLHRRVREVRMVQNGIRPQGIAHLLREGLSHAAELRVLDLEDNTLTYSGAEALAEVAPRWAAIRDLGVSDSLLSAKGGVVFAAALARGQNPQLEVLRLQYNDITAPGLKGFADAARDGLPALRKIELHGNKFAEEDPSVLALQALLEARKEKFTGKVDENAWGVYGLDDLEELGSDEEEDESNEEQEEKAEVKPEVKAEKLIKDAEEAAKEPVAQKKDSDVDALAQKLEDTQV